MGLVDAVEGEELETLGCGITINDLDDLIQFNAAETDVVGAADELNLPRVVRGIQVSQWSTANEGIGNVLSIIDSAPWQAPLPMLGEAGMIHLSFVFWRFFIVSQPSGAERYGCLRGGEVRAPRGQARELFLRSDMVD